MFGSIARSVGAVVAGLVVAAVCITGIEVGTLALHPFPPEFFEMDQNDTAAAKAAICGHVERFPAWVLALGALGWALTAFASAGLRRGLEREGTPATEPSSA